MKRCVRPLVGITLIIVFACVYGAFCISTEKYPGIESTVHIVNDTQGWQGSGVAIGPDLILTARHVVEGGEAFTITLNDGTEVKAARAVSHKDYDVGFIKLDEPILTSARLGSANDLQLGDEVYAIGSPFGKENFNSLTVGVVSGLDRSFDNDSYGWGTIFSVDAAGHPGNSGCPVFSSDGKVVGILVGGYSPVLVYCVPVDCVVEDLGYIEAMFILDDYYFEKQSGYSYEGSYQWLKKIIK